MCQGPEVREGMAGWAGRIQMALGAARGQEAKQLQPQLEIGNQETSLHTPRSYMIH